MRSEKLYKVYSDRYTCTRRYSAHSIDPEVRNEVSDLILERGSYREAIDRLDREEFVENDPLALKTRAMAKASLKDFTGAEVDLDQSEAILRFEMSAVYVNKSLVHIEKKMYEDAIVCALKARQFNPKWALPYVNHMCALVSSGRVDQSWLVLDELSKLWPEGRKDGDLIWHIKNDGILSPLRADPSFDSKIVKYVELH